MAYFNEQLFDHWPLLVYNEMKNGIFFTVMQCSFGEAMVLQLLLGLDWLVVVSYFSSD